MKCRPPGRLRTALIAAIEGLDHTVVNEAPPSLATANTVLKPRNSNESEITAHRSVVKFNLFA